MKEKIKQLIYEESSYNHNYDKYELREQDIEILAEEIVKLFAIPVVSERTLGINSCAALIKSMPTDQAMQIMKSDITGQPQTTVIDGELVVAYVR
jgi:hypothetical protein